MPEQILRLGIDPGNSAESVAKVSSSLDRVIAVGEKAVLTLDRLEATFKEASAASSATSKEISQSWSVLVAKMQEVGDRTVGSLERLETSLKATKESGEKAAADLGNSWAAFTTTLKNSLELAKMGFDMLKSGFSFAQELTEIQELKQNFSTVATSVGLDSETMLESFRNATENTIQDAGMMKSALKAMRMGVSVDMNELSKLFMIAKAKSDEGFGGTTEIFDTMVQAIATGQKRTLMSMGFISDSFKKAKDSADVLLSRTEMMNVIMEQGADSVDTMGKAGDSSADAFDRFTTGVSRLKENFAQLLPALIPIVNELAELTEGLQEFLRIQGLLDKGKNPYIGQSNDSLEMALKKAKLELAAEDSRISLIKAKNAGAGWNDIVQGYDETALNNAKETVNYLTEAIKKNKELSENSRYTELLREGDERIAAQAQKEEDREKAAKKNAAESKKHLAEMKEELKAIDEENEQINKLNSENADWTYKILQNQKNIQIESGKLSVNADLAWKAMMKASGASLGFENSLTKMIPLSAELAKNIDAVTLLSKAQNVLKNVLGERYAGGVESFLTAATTQKPMMESFFGSIENFVSDFYSAMSQDKPKEKMKVSLKKDLSEIFSDALLEGAKSGDWLSSIGQGLSQVVTQAFSNKFPVVSASGSINFGNLGTNLIASAVVGRLTGTGGLFGSRKINGAEAINQAASINDQVSDAEKKRWSLYSSVGISSETAKQLGSLPFYTAGYSWRDSGDGVFSKRTTTYQLNAAKAQESLKKFSELQKAAEFEAAARELEKSLKALTDPMEALSMDLSDLKDAYGRATDALGKQKLEVEIAQKTSELKAAKLSGTQGFLNSYLSNPLLEYSNNGNDFGFGQSQINSMTQMGSFTFGSNGNTELWRQQYFGKAASKERAAEYDLYKQQIEAGNDPEKLMAYQKKQKDVLTARVDTLGKLRDEFKNQMDSAYGSIEEQTAALERYQQVDAAYWETKSKILDNEKAMADLVAQKQAETNSKVQEDIIGTLLTRVGETKQIGGQTVVVVSAGGQNDTSSLTKKLEDSVAGIDPALASVIEKIVSNIVKQQKGNW